MYCRNGALNAIKNGSTHKYVFPPLTTTNLRVIFKIHQFIIQYKPRKSNPPLRISNQHKHTLNEAIRSIFVYHLLLTRKRDDINEYPCNKLVFLTIYLVTSCHLAKLVYINSYHLCRPPSLFGIIMRKCVHAHSSFCIYK